MTKRKQQELAAVLAAATAMTTRPPIEISAERYIQTAAKAGVKYPVLAMDGEQDTPETVTIAEAGAGEIEVRINGPIDWFFGVDVDAIIARLDEANPTAINLLVSSPGGNAWDALTLYADLRARAAKGTTITAEARGIVASAAAWIYAAADTRTAVQGSVFMIHNPMVSNYFQGTADEFRAETKRIISVLATTETTMVDIFAERTNTPEAQVKAQMEAETWFTIAEAIDANIVQSETAAVQEDLIVSAQAIKTGRAILANYAGKIAAKS